MATSTATFTYAGRGTVDVEVETGSTVRDLLQSVSDDMGLDLERATIIVAGAAVEDLDEELANLTDEDEPTVVAAPNVANG